MHAHACACRQASRDLTFAPESKILSRRAMVYSDDAVLERHHLASAFAHLHTPEYNFLSRLPSEQYRDFRRVVVAMVLATDLKVRAGT